MSYFNISCYCLIFSTIFWRLFDRQKKPISWVMCLAWNRQNMFRDIYVPLAWVTTFFKYSGSALIDAYQIYFIQIICCDTVTKDRDTKTSIVYDEYVVVKKIYTPACFGYPSGYLYERWQRICFKYHNHNLFSISWIVRWLVSNYSWTAYRATAQQCHKLSNVSKHFWEICDCPRYFVGYMVLSINTTYVICHM